MDYIIEVFVLIVCMQVIRYGIQLLYRSRRSYSSSSSRLTHCSKGFLKTSSGLSTISWKSGTLTIGYIWLRNSTRTLHCIQLLYSSLQKKWQFVDLYMYNVYNWNQLPPYIVRGFIHKARYETLTSKTSPVVTFPNMNKIINSTGTSCKWKAAKAATVRIKSCHGAISTNLQLLWVTVCKLWRSNKGNTGPIKS